MELIDKSKLSYTYVCPRNDPNNVQKAVMASDIAKLPVYTITKNICGREIPFDVPASEKSTGRLSVDDSLVIARTMRGLSGVEQEALEVLCDYIENQLEKEE